MELPNIREDTIHRYRALSRTENPARQANREVRDAYLNQIMARHPDAAGSKKALKAQQGTKLSRKISGGTIPDARYAQKFDQALKNTTTEMQSYDPTKRTIFVSLRVYCDLEAQHTLRSLFQCQGPIARVRRHLLTIQNGNDHRSLFENRRTRTVRLPLTTRSIA